MSAPAHLSAAGRRMWAQAERELRQRGVWRPVCAPLLERMILNRLEATSALAVASASPTVEGSTGQLVAHPLFAIAARCDQLALSLARALTLTPATGSHDVAETVDLARDEKAPAATDEVDELAKWRERGA